MTKIDDIIEVIEDLRDEEGVSKFLQDKLDEIIHVLREDIDVELRVDRTRSILDELEEITIPNYHRTQLWNINALLEML